jgi:hypothetical protein
MLYPNPTPAFGVPLADWTRCHLAGGLAEDVAMTIEIIHLTAQIHRWLNLQVARHLEAQAAKFTH